MNVSSRISPPTTSNCFANQTYIASAVPSRKSFVSIRLRQAARYTGVARCRPTRLDTRSFESTRNCFISDESIRSATTTSGHAFTKPSVRRLECKTRSRSAKASSRPNMSRKRLRHSTTSNDTEH